jgi:hypothetical protein
VYPSEPDLPSDLSQEGSEPLAVSPTVRDKPDFNSRAILGPRHEHPEAGVRGNAGGCHDQIPSSDFFAKHGGPLVGETVRAMAVGLMSRIAHAVNKIRTNDRRAPCGRTSGQLHLGEWWVEGSYMLDQAGVPEARIRHLEMIQGIVDRLSGHGASSKNFCITVATATLGLAAALQMPKLALLAVVQVVAFAIIDAQYLSVERRYRQLFNRVRSAGLAEPTTFDLRAEPHALAGFWRAFGSWSVWCFYVPALVGVGIAYGVLEVAYG